MTNKPIVLVLRFQLKRLTSRLQPPAVGDADKHTLE